MNRLQLGDSAPSFTLPRAEGGDYSLQQDLSERKGWRFVIFFRGSWCPVCNEELQDIQENLSYFEGKDIHFTFVSTDNQQDLNEMKEKHGLTFPVLADATEDILKQYGVYYHGEDALYEDHGVHGEPAYYLLDEEGKLMYQQQQTSPFGRPHSKELRKIAAYIRKNLK